MTEPTRRPDGEVAPGGPPPGPFAGPAPFAPPAGPGPFAPPAGPGPFASPAGTTAGRPDAPAPRRDDGWYPEQAYYAPGWSAAPSGTTAHRRRRTRRLVARTGAVVGTVALVAVVAVGARTWADSRPLGDPTGAVSAHPRQLDVGHCLQTLPGDGTVRRVTVLPCAESHEAEVLSRHRHADGAWPGAAEVRREAAATCEMDTAQRSAGVRPVVWTPTEASWRQGDRESLCLAWLPGSGLRGSWTAGDIRLP